MDAQMPVMDGIEATQEILEFEQEEEIGHTPIIAVTANVLKGDRERFLGAGMDEYISKPIEKDKLIKILERVAHGDFSKTYETQQNAEEAAAVDNQHQNNTTPTQQQSENDTKVILATNSPFLSTYIKQVLNNDVIIANDIDSLTTMLTQHGTITVLIDEHFEKAGNIKELIKSIKKLGHKVVALADSEIKEADITIIDLKPETIQSALKG
jgi:CheY-like chemotaxis protein